MASGRKLRIGILASEEGTTLQSVLDACSSGHQVDEEYDHGPIVAQTIVPIVEGDDVDSLSARVREVERLFLVQTLEQLANGRGDLHSEPKRR